MAGLVAPDICRYTVNGVYAGRPVANVLDVGIFPTGATTRHTAIGYVAEIIISSWADDVCDNISDNYTAESLSWVDLDSSSGEVGNSTNGATTDFPFPGQASADAMPGNVSMRVNKNIVAARGQRQGRMYLVGCVETYTTDASPNTLQAGTITAINSDMAAFLAKVGATFSGGVTGDADLVVLHTHLDTSLTPPEIVYDGYSVVGSLTCDSTLSSQRRRLRG